MVDSINNGSASALLQAQSAGLNALRQNQQIQQTFVGKHANGAKPTTVQPAFKAAGSTNKSLPRGSLVDILA